MNEFDFENADGTMQRAKVLRPPLHREGNYIIGDGGFSVYAPLAKDSLSAVNDRLEAERINARDAGNNLRFAEAAAELYAHELAIEENKRRDAEEREKNAALALVLHSGYLRGGWREAAAAARKHLAEESK